MKLNKIYKWRNYYIKYPKKIKLNLKIIKKNTIIIVENAIKKLIKWKIF